MKKKPFLTKFLNPVRFFTLVFPSKTGFCACIKKVGIKIELLAKSASFLNNLMAKTNIGWLKISGKLKTTYAWSILYFSGIYESPWLAKLEMLLHSPTIKKRALWAIKYGVFPRIFDWRDRKDEKITIFDQISCHCLFFHACIPKQNQFPRLYSKNRDKNWTDRAIRIFLEWFCGKSKYLLFKNLLRS